MYIDQESKVYLKSSTFDKLSYFMISPLMNLQAIDSTELELPKMSCYTYAHVTSVSNYNTLVEIDVGLTTMRRRGLDLSGCCGSSSTASGIQRTPSTTVPSLMAIKCRLFTAPSIVAMYLEPQ